MAEISPVSRKRAHVILETDTPLSDTAGAMRDALAQDGSDPQQWFDYGVTLAAEGHFRQAVRAFSRAIAREPFCGRYHLARGHRHLSCWEFDEGTADLTMASRLLPGDWDAWYHLGVGYFLTGEFDRALESFVRCDAVNRTEGEQAACMDWRWMTLMRLGRSEEAERLIRRLPDLQAEADPGPYHRRLQMYRGELAPESLIGHPVRVDAGEITTAYGLSNYYLVTGNMNGFTDITNQILDAGAERWWYAFGYIAAHVDALAHGMDVPEGKA